MDRRAPRRMAPPEPVDADHEPGGLPLTVILLMLAGWVDALGVTQWHGLYVSFMSGNTTALGASPAIGDWRGAAEAGRAVALFVASVTAGELIGPGAGRWRGAAVVGAEAALLWLAVTSSLLGWGDVATTAITGFAMGLQTAAVHKVDGTGVALTYVTGTLVNLGRSLASALRGAASWRRAMPYLGFWAALLAGAAGGAVVARIATADALAIAAAVATILTALSALAGLSRKPRDPEGEPE